MLNILSARFVSTSICLWLCVPLRRTFLHIHTSTFYFSKCTFLAISQSIFDDNQPIVTSFCFFFSPHIKLLSAHRQRRMKRRHTLSVRARTHRRQTRARLYASTTCRRCDLILWKSLMAACILFGAYILHTNSPRKLVNVILMSLRQHIHVICYVTSIGRQVDNGIFAARCDECATHTHPAINC